MAIWYKFYSLEFVLK